MRGKRIKKILPFYGVIWGMSFVGLLIIGLPSSLSSLWYPSDGVALLRAFLSYILLVPVGVGLFLLSSFLEGRIRVNSGVLEGLLAMCGFFLIILPPIRYFYFFALSEVVSWDAIMRFILIVVFLVLPLFFLVWVFRDIFSNKQKKS
jgi:hypothetical protein